MKYTVNGHELAIEVTNEPILTFEEVEIAHPSGAKAFIAGAPRWNRLETVTDLTALYGQTFDMESDTWIVEGCVVCVVPTEIYYRNARQKVQR